MSNIESIEKHKQELEKRRVELMRQIEKDSEPHNPGNDVSRPGEEEADEAEDFQNQLAMAQAMRDEVQEIDRALERIQEGKYGICVKCGAKISEDVLDAAPESILCESCKISA